MITRTETYNDMISGKKLKRKIQTYNHGTLMNERYYLNDKLHREDGPAFIGYYGDRGVKQVECYYLNDKLHRENGPAKFSYNNSGKLERETYYLNGYEIEDPLQLLVLETLKGENGMRWKKKAKVKDGETRTVSKFLILPKTIKGETRWLENASWIEKARWENETKISPFTYATKDVLHWNPVDWLENCVMDKLTE